MSGLNGTLAVHVRERNTPHKASIREVSVPNYERERLEDIGFVTAMTLTLLGNYAQTGHFGGPLAYTPYNVALHLAGPTLGGLRYDYRRPKHPFGDRFLVAGGHNIPTSYALWMIMGQAMANRHAATGDAAYQVDPKVAMLPIDCLGFRRGAGALETLLTDHDLQDDPLFAQAKLRGIRSLAGHSETTDLTNDVNGGPSGIGVATAGGKAAFWDFAGAPSELKVVALEGEFAMTAGHAQELKTQALAQQVGKRLRVLLSFNNAGIDDRLLDGVLPVDADSYQIENQWSSYGWNVLSLDDGNDYDQIVAALKTMEEWDVADRRPMIVVGRTTKGWWPAASDGQIPGFGDQVVSFKSHPYDMKMNVPYFVALAKTFEERFDVTFEGIEDGPVADEKQRIIQFKTNIDVAMSVLEKDRLGDWLAERMVAIGDSVIDDVQLRIDNTLDPFQDKRLEVRELPTDPQSVTIKHPVSGEESELSVTLFQEPGKVAGTRRAISEVVKWLNVVTDNRFISVSADLSGSINVEAGSLTGHYDPVRNPAGTRLKAAIQEAGNALTAIGLVGQSASLNPEVHSGVWAISGSYGAFTPLMYLPARVWSQQNQDSPFRVGVLNILAGHSGPETAADARTHFGIFAPQVWRLFPRGQVINLSFWDYNDVASGYFAAAEIAARDPLVGVIVIEVARPDFPVADRTGFADSDIRAASKGFYVIRDFDMDRPRHGYVLAQGSSSTFNLLQVLPRLEEAGVNIKVVACISEELFARQPDAYRNVVLPPEAKLDMMVVTTGTQRMWPMQDPGPLTHEYSLTSDSQNRWLSGGSESDVIGEAHLDQDSIFAGVKRFADDRGKRMGRLREQLAALAG